MGASAGKNGDEGNIHVSNKNIGLVQMHLCLISMVLLPGEENNSHRTIHFYESFLISNTITLK